MAIGTNTSIDFFGTQDELTTASSIVASDNFSVIADTGTWTNDDDAPEASLTLNGTLAISAVAGKSIDVYIRKMNVQGVNDDLVPNVNFNQTYIGSFTMSVGTAQLQTIDIPLPNFKTSSEYDFYIDNQSGQSLNAGWTLHITPKTVGPKA